MTPIATSHHSHSSVAKPSSDANVQDPTPGHASASRSRPVVFIVDGGVAARAVSGEHREMIQNALDLDNSFSVRLRLGQVEILPRIAHQLGNHATDVALLVLSQAPGARIIDCQLLRGDSDEALLDDLSLSSMTKCFGKIRDIILEQLAAGKSVVNVSIDTWWGCEDDDPEWLNTRSHLEEIIEELCELGCEVLVAVGNMKDHSAGCCTIGPLAACGNVVAVGSIDPATNRPWKDNRQHHSHLGVARPDWLIRTGNPSPVTRRTLIATSYACAIGSGHIAQRLSSFQDTSVHARISEMRRLRGSSDPVVGTADLI